MTWALVSGATGSHAQLLDLGRPSMLAYAERWEMDFVEADMRGPLPASWYKIPALRDALVSHEGALWVDADALFRRDDVWIGDCATHAWNWVYHDQSTLDRSYPTPVWTLARVPNCGVLAVREEGAGLLDLVWNKRDRFADHPWWEQGAAHELFGWEGDRNCRFVRQTPWTHLQGQLPGDWNSAPANPQPDPIIAHYCGLDHAERLREMSRPGRVAG